VSFKVNLAEAVWLHLRKTLPITAQESLLDLIERLGEHPGDEIDRPRTLSARRGALTRPIRFEEADAFAELVVVFQYDADERTIHVYDVKISRA